MLHTMSELPRHSVAHLPGVVVALCLAGCALPASRLGVGMPEAEVLRTMGPPSSRYALPAGTRLEYATGPYGRSTWMVDLDADGRARAWRQVLDERHLMAVQGQLPGMSRDQLLLTLGRPGEVRSGGWQGGQVWSWRFDTHLCLWFQVSLGDDGLVRDGAFGPDPICDDDGERGPTQK